LMLVQTQRLKDMTQEVADLLSWYKQELAKTGIAEWKSLKEEYRVSKQKFEMW